MSFRDTLDIATSSHNGIYAAETGSASGVFVPEFHVGQRALLQAITDLIRFCHYGMITQKGVCKPWPSKIQISKQGHRITRYMMVNGTRDPQEHRKLKEFFLGGYGQQLCDWVGFRYPAADAFWRIVKREGARK